MGVNQAQALETRGCCTEKIQAGNENAPGVADNDHDDGATAIDEQADLAMEAAGEQGELPRQLICAYSFRRGTPTVEFLQ
ncbi:MAG TPA: hypothetical protein PLC37_06980 [Smithellaceae bacterium]|nr:hypothetical protein [Smithellaceae bacterium]